MPETDSDEQMVAEYLAESREHLAGIEADLLAIEQRGADVEEATVNRAFRAAHSIKGGAGFFDLRVIQQLAHKTENVLDLVRSRKLVPSAEVLNILLLSFDKLRELVEDHQNSNEADIEQFLAAMTAVSTLEAGPVTALAPAEAPLAPPLTGAASSGSTEKPAADSTLRIGVSLLDSLMNLAGELVLSRNELIEAIQGSDKRAIDSAAQRIHLVTTEVQEAVMLTRMQPVGNAFSRFPRLVRDLSQELGKEIQLSLEGNEVEMDKAIVEGLSDPLTHMVRNAADHGLENPADRLAAGKGRAGTIRMRAWHQAGQVLIEVSDDGRGIDSDRVVASAIARGMLTEERAAELSPRERLNLIFLPAVSTSISVTGVSGRGVGMDVVKTNLDRLGGKIDIESRPGRGSSFLIRLPLTLAIMPCLLVSGGESRFAIPQADIRELIRVPAGQAARMIQWAAANPVLVLRDRLIPLLRLGDVLGFPSPPEGGTRHIAVLDGGGFDYALEVSAFGNAAQIVVKPLGVHFKGLNEYGGAAILGDGRVALILNPPGLASKAGIGAVSDDGADADRERDEAGVTGGAQPLLLFHNSPEEPCAVPLDHVVRIERIGEREVQELAGKRTITLNSGALPLLTLGDACGVRPLESGDASVVVVLRGGGREVGLLAREPLDVVEPACLPDTVTLRQKGVAGSLVIRGKNTLWIDVPELLRSVYPQWDHESPTVDRSTATVLIAEDSDFFREQLCRIVRATGCHILEAPDGEIAWRLLQEHAGTIQLVTTDIEMPECSGLEFTRRIRADGRFDSLPVIMLSSLAADEEVARGLSAGASKYLIKLNEDEYSEAVRAYLAGAGAGQTGSEKKDVSERHYR